MSKMEFDKSRVYTALNADELKPGSKIFAADCLSTLKRYVEDDDGIVTLEKVNDEMHLSRFFDGESSWCLAYLVSEPEEPKLKWTDLKIGDIITDGCVEAMVIQINKYNTHDAHILAGNIWISDEALEKWEKVED